jgi:glycosyltransferase involved in cell wall biosynthesis
VPADDAEAMANAVSQLLPDERRRRRLGQAGRRRAEEKFDINYWSARMVEIYGFVAS